MNRNLIGAMLFILASCGCRTCDCRCDYLPPVLDGPYSSHGLRSGSTIASKPSYADNAIENNIETAAPLADQAVTPLSMPE